MPKSPKKKPSSQIERFKEAAQELGCDESEDAFDKRLRKIAQAPPPQTPKPKPKPKKQTPAK